MKYSVIIPVYNSEKYLRDCVKSVSSQTHRDIEIILVDDESSDSSPDICRELASVDARIKYIRKENGGTSAARNTGIDNATGEYLMFIDNDDLWTDMKAVEEINKLLEESEADVLMFNTAVLDNATGEVDWIHESIERDEVYKNNPGEALRAVLKHGLMARAVWARVFKREMIEENHIRFPEGMRNEDTAFTAETILHAKTYDWYDNVFYHYRVNSGYSQTSEPINKSQLDDLRDILLLYSKKGGNLDEGLKKAFYSYLSFPYAVWIGYSMVNKDTTKNEIAQMKNLDFVFKYDWDKNVEKLSLAYRVIGYRGVCYLLKLWVKKNRS